VRSERKDVGAAPVGRDDDPIAFPSDLLRSRREGATRRGRIAQVPGAPAGNRKTHASIYDTRPHMIQTEPKQQQQQGQTVCLTHLNSFPRNFHQRWRSEGSNGEEEEEED
jgi:hypothetical protein